MKKILTVLLTVLLAFAALSITAFAESGAGAVAQMPYVEGNDGLPDEKIPENGIPDFDLPDDEEEFPFEFDDEYDDGEDEEYELSPEMEDSIFAFGATVAIVGMLFMPALIATIIFAVLNSKTKKEIARYERVFGSANGFNAAQQNYAPNYTQNYGQGGNMQ